MSKFIPFRFLCRLVPVVTLWLFAGAVSAADKPDAWSLKRPQPADLDFFKIKDKLQAYVKTVPEAQQALEKERIREISTMRNYLIKMMKFMPYEADQRGIRLKDGKTAKGALYATEEELALKSRHGKFRKLGWEALAVAQYIQFFDYYLNLRLTRVEAGAKDKGEDLIQRRREAAADSFRLALFCDWYGEKQAASKYAGQAAEFDPELADRVKQFFAESATP